MKPFAECQLYTFIDTAYLAGRSPELVARQLCDGGSDLIQLRAKSMPIDDVRQMAQSIQAITSRSGVRLVINDYLGLAEEVGAEFCHLGQEDLRDAGHPRIAELKARGSLVGIGLSTHSSEQAALAVEAGADYVAIGPVYPTETKPTARAVTLDYVRWAAANVSLPWFAIGGINLRTLDEVLAAGARRIAVVSAILNAPDVVGTCQRFRDRLASVAQ